MPAPLPELVVPSISPTQRLVELPAVRLVDAQSGEPPRLPTSLRVALRGDTLCVRFDGRDEGVVATYRNRDENLWEEDVFEVFLAPVDPPHLYFEFEVNPLGTLFDARVDSPNLVRAGMNVDTSWDCAGLSATVRQRAGKVVGGAVDSRSASSSTRSRGAGGRTSTAWIAGPPSGAKDEFSAWSPIVKQPADFHEAERFGMLRLES